MRGWRYLPYLFPLLAATLLIVFESNFLFQAQERNLFLHTPLFFEQQMVKPGGLLTWAGTYLTQYFYYPALGAGLLCLLWVLFMWLTQHVFRLPKTWMAMTLVPVACLLTAITSLGYWVYYLKLPGHMFDATLGALVAVSLTELYKRSTRLGYSSTAFLLIATAVAYPLFGFYGLLAMLLMSIMAWRTSRHPAIDSTIAVAGIIVMPIACYHLVYHETNIVNIYWAALPVFSHTTERCFAYYTPYIILVASLIIMALFYSKERDEKPLKRQWLWLQATLLTITTACVVVFWQKDDNFHRELSMMRSLEKQDWQQMLKIAKSAKDEPTRAMCMMQNLALFQLGRQGDEMYTYPIGAKHPNAPFQSRIIHTVGRTLYLHYGMTNYCYRWCMEDGVEYGWTVEKLKLMTLCALVNNELAVAQKYLNLLRKTTFHKSWAKRYSQYLRNPSMMMNAPEFRAIISLRDNDNYITNDMSLMEMFLLEHFSTTMSGNPLIQEQSMLAAMQTKNAQLFLTQFFGYARQRQGQHMPRHYQEAACLFGNLEGMDTSNMPFDPSVRRNYEEMAVAMNTLHQKGMDIDQMRPHIPAHLRSTYFFDYYFNSYDFLEN